MQRSRRHTIARPASAMRLLATDSDTDNEDEQIDRISDMLSVLIQEANEAVNHKSIAMLRKPPSSLDMHQFNLQRKRLARPISYPSSSRRLTKRRSINIQESSTRRSLTPGKQTRKPDQVITPLTDSFKRLDSSLAAVDSLSRDLVPPQELISAFDARLSMLLLLPLLPHAFISVVFGSLLSYDDHTDSASFILVLIVMFGFTNIIFEKPGKKKKGVLRRQMKRRHSF